MVRQVSCSPCRLGCSARHRRAWRPCSWVSRWPLQRQRYCRGGFVTAGCPGYCLCWASPVLLVDLLTTGGIGFPSVANSMWLLLALGLAGERPRTVQARVAWAAIFVLIGLAITCYRTAYQPVMECQAQLRLAERRADRAVECLEAATAADPWAAEPWRQWRPSSSNAGGNVPTKQPSIVSVALPIKSSSCPLIRRPTGNASATGILGLSLERIAAGKKWP